MYLLEFRRKTYATCHMLLVVEAKNTAVEMTKNIESA